MTRQDNRENEAQPEGETRESNSSSSSAGGDHHTDGGGTDFSFRPHTDDSITHVDIDADTAGATRRGGGGGGTTGWNDSNRVRGFHDMICVGFAVSLCLNLGSLTARREGFFAAEVECLPEGAAQTVLVSNDYQQFRLFFVSFVVRWSDETRYISLKSCCGEVVFKVHLYRFLSRCVFKQQIASVQLVALR